MSTISTSGTLQTFRFTLEPDKDLPVFKRLHWSLEPVSIRDVLCSGVHPWGGQDKHYTLDEGFLMRLNASETKLAELDSFGYCADIGSSNGYVRDRLSRFERMLENVRTQVYFVDDLSYIALLAIATDRLRKSWDCKSAYEMLQLANPGFQEMRHFLKAKSSDIRISSYDDFRNLDLSEILSVEDFVPWDRLIIQQGIPSANFRRASFLEQVTDTEGRLRLTDEIRNLSITEKLTGIGIPAVTWNVRREGEGWRFRPDLTNNVCKRLQAHAFALKWRTDHGRFCFTTSIEQVCNMVETNAAIPSFPALDYVRNTSGKPDGPQSSVSVFNSHVPAFRVGAFLQDKHTGERLRAALQHFGVSATGNKEELTHKLATLSAKLYRNHLPTLDRFFARNSFIRIQNVPPDTREIPVLEDLNTMRNMVLTLYAMKHLRGDTILEAGHQNDTYTVEELALALVTGKVALTGAFMRVT